MSENIDFLYTRWTEVTAKLPYGVQKVFRDVFDLAQQTKTTLIYGADFRGGFPCLVNTVGNMLSATDGKSGYGIPSLYFGEVVSLFDEINRELEYKGVNFKPGYVSPLAADILLMHFAPVKEPVQIDAPKAIPVLGSMPYTEATDEEMAAAMVELFTMNETDPALNINLTDFNTEPAPSVKLP